MFDLCKKDNMFECKGSFCSINYHSVVVAVGGDEVGCTNGAVVGVEVLPVEDAGQKFLVTSARYRPNKAQVNKLHKKMFIKPHAM